MRYVCQLLVLWFISMVGLMASVIFFPDALASPAEQASLECRKAAALPSEEGPSFEYLNALSAIQICQRAVEQDPANHANVAYLARALVKADRAQEAWSLIEPLLDSDSPAIQAYLGVMFANGYGVAADVLKAAIAYGRSAEKGNADAAVNLGILYEDGQGVGLDYVKAVRWYRKAADLKYPFGFIKLAHMFEDGLGVKTDGPVALELLHEAAILGDAEGQYLYASALDRGGGAKPDPATGFVWYRLAAEQGHVAAQVKLAEMLGEGTVVTKDDHSSYNWFLKAANAGDGYAQVKVGNALENGVGVPEDKKAAFEWYRKSAEQGHAQGQFALALAYEQGIGTVQNTQKAVQWFQKSAQQGHSRAQASLGWRLISSPDVIKQAEGVSWIRKSSQQDDPAGWYYQAQLYYHGSLVEKDLSRSLDLYYRSARAGTREAQYQAGWMLVKGEGVPADEISGAALIQRSADQGFDFAYETLGAFSRYGIGVPIDTKAAFNWYRKAADVGVTNSMTRLAEMYLAGEGTTKDVQEALRWLFLAAKDGDTDAQARLGELYISGTEVAKNTDVAFAWFLKAARAGHTEAKRELATLYLDGIPEPDFAAGARWLLDAAIAGDEAARGQIILNVGNKSNALSDALRSPPLQKQLSSAATNIAISYEEVYFDCFAAMLGCGESSKHRLDLDEAAKWYRVASKDDPVAEFRLARLLTTHPDLEVFAGEGNQLLATAAARSPLAEFYQTATGAKGFDDLKIRQVLSQKLRGFSEEEAAKIAVDAAIGRMGDPAIGVAFQYLLEQARSDPSHAGVGLVAVYGFYGAFGKAADVAGRISDVRWFDAFSWDYSIERLINTWLEELKFGVRPSETQVADLGSFLSLIANKGSRTAMRLSSRLDVLRQFMTADSSDLSGRGVRHTTPGAAERALAAIERRINQEEERGRVSPILVILYQRLASVQFTLGAKKDAQSSRLTALSIDEEINAGTRHIRGSVIYYLEKSCKLRHASDDLYSLGSKEVALTLAKSSVNAMQEARRALVGLPADLQGCFTSVVGDQYRAIANLFIKQEHFGEAEWVLRQLKDFEAYKYADNEVGAAGLAFDAIPMDELQSSINHRIYGLPLTEQYRLQQRRVSLIQQKVSTEADKIELEDVERRLAAASAENDAGLERLNDAINALEDADKRSVAKLSHQDLQRWSNLLNDLNRETAIIYTVVLPDGIDFILSTKEGTQHFRVDVHEQTLNAMVVAMRAKITDPTKDPRVSSKALYDLLWAPLDSTLRQLSVTDVILSLDKQLRYVPIAALYDGDSYLVETYTFASLSSSKYDQLLASGGLADLTAQALGASKGGQGFDPLPNVALEIDGIVKESNDEEGLLVGQGWLDEEFNRRALSVAFSKASPVVHLATHFALGADETSSRFLLGDGQVMSLAELNKGIRDKEFDVSKTKLLVLSACETGFSNGDELESMAALMEGYGIRSVLATLWAVNDKSTAAFMRRFYSYIKDGMPRGAAIRQSQLDFIGSGKQNLAAGSDSSNMQLNYSHPSYWAPFVLLGQWK